MRYWWTGNPSGKISRWYGSHAVSVSGVTGSHAAATGVTGCGKLSGNFEIQNSLPRSGNPSRPRI